jgi:hypothetical protein
VLTTRASFSRQVSVISRTAGPGRITWDDIKQKKSLPIEVDACVQVCNGNS